MSDVLGSRYVTIAWINFHEMLTAALQLGDDPFPDPTCNAQVKPIADAGVYNGWQYEGCFTDTYSQRSLSKWLWQASSNTSIQTCTQACGSAGYSVAGLEYGNGMTPLSH